MLFEKAIDILLEGSALMFAGAGCSADATNLRDHPLLQGSDLANYLGSKAELEPNVPLEYAAEAFLDKFGEDALIEELKKEFIVKKIRDYHQSLGSYPWYRLYTANYDNVLEEAFKLSGEILSPVTAGDNPRTISKKETACIHLNGYVHRLERGKIGSELKLTDTSYVSSSIADSSWGVLFQADVRLAKAVFFVGYSLFDLDIRRLLYDSPLLKEKCFFILGNNPKPSAIQRAEKFGTVIKKTVEEFTALVNKRKKAFVPPVNRNLSIISIKEHFLPDLGTPILDRDLWDLFLYGTIDKAKVYESLSSKKQYYLERGAQENVFKFIDEGNRIIVICSNLGNGKSAFLEGLRIRALERSFRVFEVKDQTEETINELQLVSQINEKVIVTIEGYDNWLNEISKFMMNVTPNVTLILTERNAINDNAIDRLYNTTGINNIPEISLDYLTPTEIDWFTKTFNKYGFWGEETLLDDAVKQQIISHNCKKEIHAVLLDRFNSPDIGKRLKNLSKQLYEDRVAYEVFISICILNIIEQKPSFETIVHIWGPGKIGNSKFRKNPVVKQLLNFNEDEVLLKSAVAAKYILREAIDRGIIVKVLIQMAERAHLGAATSKKYQNMLSDLVRFSNLQQIFPETGKGSAIFAFYESVKNLERCNTHSLFWLQYAIACLSIKDIPRSRQYFEDAYSLAEKKPFDTFQIDNHYARFLLEEATQELEAKEAMDNFHKATTIVNQQIINEKMHYPYRVASLYQPFLDRFASLLEIHQLQEIASAALHIRTRIETLPKERFNHKYVRACMKSINYVIARVTELIEKKKANTEDVKT